MGKISSLPRHIRDELHRRLEDGQTESEILPWLNSLPETQSLLEQNFESKPISPENLSRYRRGVFRKWQLHQAALQFVQESDPAAGDATDKLATADLIERLVNHVCLRFAAAAQNCPAADDPQAEFRDLHALLADIVALRRGELISRRIALEQQRLQREASRSQQELEQIFWEWTKRPEVAAKLFPHRDPDKLRHEVVSLIDTHFLGNRATFPLDQNNHENPTTTDLDPACLV